jgi:predicted ArsR family transcriptional regulator
MLEDRREQGTTRQSILNLLRHRGQLTAGELSTDLGIGPVGVRQHLTLLERDGLVFVAGLRRGIGRPSHLYGLTPAAEQIFPKHYDRLALDLIGYVSESGGSEAVDRMLDARRTSLARRYAPRLVGKNREQQVEELCAILNELGYMSAYERLPDGSFLLVEHNCPVDCVARVHMQLCGQEIRLYEDLLGVPLERDATIAAGAHVCRYRIPPAL